VETHISSEKLLRFLNNHDIHPFDPSKYQGKEKRLREIVDKANSRRKYLSEVHKTWIGAAEKFLTESGYPQEDNLIDLETPAELVKELKSVVNDITGVTNREQVGGSNDRLIMNTYNLSDELWQILGSRIEIAGEGASYMSTLDWLKENPDMLSDKIAVAIMFLEKPYKFVITGKTADGRQVVEKVSERLSEFIPKMTPEAYNNAADDPDHGAKFRENRQQFPESLKMINVSSLVRAALLALEFGSSDKYPIISTWRRSYGVERPTLMDKENARLVKLAKGKEDSRKFRWQHYENFINNREFWNKEEFKSIF